MRGLRPQVRVFERVLLIGPPHYVRLDGIAAPSSETFATPLGEIDLDYAAIAALLDAGLVTIDDPAHAPEHLLEVELPFLQHIRLGSLADISVSFWHAAFYHLADVPQRRDQYLLSATSRHLA